MGIGYRRTRVVSLDQSRNRFSKGFWIGGILMLLLVGVSIALVWYISSVGSIEVGKGSFIITRGQSTTDLPEKWKLSIPRWRFRAYVRFFAPKIEKLKVGTYDIKEPLTIDAVFTKILPSPNVTDLTITFLPGWTLFDIDAYLSSLQIIQDGEISKLDSKVFLTLTKKYPFLEGKSSLEGFIYPDTYRIRPESDIATILSKPLSNFDEKIFSKHSDLGKDFYPTLILSSIVEKEERNVRNKALVAGALHQRLNWQCSDTGRIIGADATVCYAYAITSRACTPAFIVDHIQETTPYNTRKIAGLPPTPIANPTVSSFEAARNPDTTGGYCYYLHDSNGEIHFGKTSEDHSRNKAQYLGR